MSDSLWPHGLQHARLPCPSPTPKAYSNSCPWSRWCHPTISSSVIPFSSHLQSFQQSGSFQTTSLFKWSVLRIRWPKYWSFSFNISPSNEHSGLISFRMENPRIRVFSNESTLRMRWPKYWSFNFSIIPFKEIPGLISFRMDRLVQSKGLKSLFQHHNLTPQINSSALSLLHSPTLTSIHDHRNNHSLD